ncbi:MAG: glycosyltransferase family 2 protein [Verrucomicrobia bacterium]|nr:glycosyltransferase family 2 protein [Verrucomicrobiota bacterium]
MITWIAAASCLLALIPAALFLRNLALYAPLPQPGPARAKCSVLIPARNEETNIAAALNSILQSDGIELEVIVLDDSSTDRTAGIVRDLAVSDPRVRLETAEPLHPGWCGKNFACHQLAALAKHPLLVFMDADVRISRPDSLARLAAFMDQSRAALVSGVPHEETRGLTEKLIIPLIHFVLLGFLPLERMRKSTDPRFAAACGQILAVRREAYDRVGGHTTIANRIHDAVALTRTFRSNGFKTDLFDATDTFHCRMYQRSSEVWHGFAKNAHEGLGSPQLIVPTTLLLLGGQVLPFALLAFAKSALALTFAIIGTVAAFLPRLIAIVRFRQSILGALLHPVGICALVAIQWFAFFRSLLKRPATWKGREYLPVPAP